MRYLEKVFFLKNLNEIFKIKVLLAFEFVIISL